MLGAKWPLKAPKWGLPGAGQVDDESLDQQQLTANWPLFGNHTHLVLSNYAAIMKARLLPKQVAERSPRRMSDADKARYERDDKRRTAIRWTMSTIQANEQTTNVALSIKSFTVKVNGKLSGWRQSAPLK